MSDFLENLNKNARTENEVAIEQKQAADRREMLEKEKNHQHQKQLEKNFDYNMKEFLKEIKESCIEAVRDARYITYNGTRYLCCSIALMYSYKYYDGDGYYDVWLQFNCFKLEKNHIIPSKRKYTATHISKTISSDPSELNCERGLGKRYLAPEYVNLASDVQNNLDGYTDIHVLPKKIATANFPQREIQRGIEFTEPLTKHDFLIKF